jgi:hypothetical protein
MEYNIVEVIITGGVAVITFFLKDLFARFKELEEKVDHSISKYQTEFGKMVGRVSQIDTKATAELKRLEEMMNVHFKNQSDKLEELQRMIERINNNR